MSNLAPGSGPKTAYEPESCPIVRELYPRSPRKLLKMGLSTDLALPAAGNRPGTELEISVPFLSKILTVPYPIVECDVIIKAIPNGNM